MQLFFFHIDDIFDYFMDPIKKVGKIKVLELKLLYVVSVRKVKTPVIFFFEEEKKTNVVSWIDEIASES